MQTKKKGLRLVAALLFMVVMMLGMTVTAYAEETHVHNNITFTPISTYAELQALFENGGSGYLTTDISYDSWNPVGAGKTVNLCLNGHTLTKVRLGAVNSTLNLYDCCSCGKLTGGSVGTGGAIHVSEGGIFNMYGGMIYKCNATNGGGVYVADATSTFNLYGGVIDSCTSYYGGGVYTVGKFNMYGGAIQNCSTSNTSGHYGGGVYVNAGGTMYMNGGVIKNNKANKSAHGGGVYVRGGVAEWDGSTIPGTAQFVMAGGEISGNYAHWSGGGVFMEANGSFLMTGGLISGNTSGSYGTGVGVFSGSNAGNVTSWVYIKGGTITNNDVKRDSSGRAMMHSKDVTLTGTATFNGTYTTLYKVNSNTEFANALNAIPAYTHAAIELQANLTGYYSLTNKYITIDLNGHNITNANKRVFWFEGCQPINLINTSTMQSNITHTGSAGTAGESVYLKNVGGCTLNLKGKIYIDRMYVAGGTAPIVMDAGVGVTTFDHRSSSSHYYSVYFDANGGIGAPGTANKNHRNNMGLSAITPYRSGYTLKGWNTAANGTGTNYGFTYTTNATTTLYAQWSQNQYLTYNANGHGTAPNTVTMTYNTVTNAADAISATGYTFNGWNTKADGTGTAYAVGAEVKKANVDPAATTLYAQWTENTATLAYNANGRGEAPGNVTMKTSAATNAAAAITGVTGYTFNIWNTEADGTGTAYAAGAQVKAANVDPVATTLYAQWTTNTYTVTLNNGEGSGDASLTATYDAYLPDVTVPTWEKHVFEGYFTEAKGRGVKYIDETGKGVKVWDLTADTTLYAFWKESAKIESMDLLLGGDIGLRYHVAVNDTALRESGKATVSIGSKKSSTVEMSCSTTDKAGFYLFPFTVSSVQMAELVKVEFKDKDGKVIAEDAKSVEDYYNLVKGSDTTSDDQKEMVRTLVNYGYHAQQALSKTNGWSIGTDYKASTQHGSLSSTADDLKAYKPVISGSDPNVKDIQLSLLLDNKTTLCIYVQTKNGDAPAVTVDGASVTPEDNGDSWWLVRITDIDALNLSAMHTVTANGYTVYLSALSYASVAGKNTIDAMRALLDYYHATLTANHKKMLTSATVTKSEYDYTGQKIEPVLTVMAGNEEVDGYHVEWNGDLINAGTYTGLVTKEGYVGGVTVTVKINPVKVTAPAAETTEFTYDGTEKTVLTADEDPPYTVTGITVATDVGSYTATVSLNNTEEAVNYCWEDGSTEDIVIEWSIVNVQTKVEKPAVPETVSFAYDETEKTLVIAASENYTVTGNTATNAGSYTATVTLKENCCWTDDSTDSITISWTITKKEIAVPTWTVNELTYTGEVQTGVTVEENVAYTLTGNTGTNAASYTAKLELKDTKNTCWSDEGKTTDAKTIVWSIARKKIGIPQAATGLVYNGAGRIGVEAGEGYKLIGVTWAINAGSYTATAELTDQFNTCWSDGTTDAKTIEWSIAKVDPKVLNGGISVTYHPNGGSVEFSGSMNVEGKFSYDPSNGTTFTPNDTNNYNTVSVQTLVTEDETPVSMTVRLDSKEETE